MSAASTVPTTTYLELSQEGAGAHKFYEVTVDGLVVTVRYGRIWSCHRKAPVRTSSTR
ncbi:WGR domain-containing protein [Streptomyces microflavus]|uniref:WGR domain-containing protein n=1 Tax=Streptomyces microflavus TaxID=1919 RepID=UPI00341BC1E4